MQQVIFLIFATVTIVSALMVVTLNNPVRCVLFLVLAFIATAGIWIMAHAEFLALVLILVYVGAVMTLFLFVVMMIEVGAQSMTHHFGRYLPLGVFVVGLLVTLLINAISPEHFTHATVNPSSNVNSAIAGISNSEMLGLVLYTHYAYAVELAAVLLLIAIISAIILVHRQPRNTKQQPLLKQLLVDSKDRVHLVKMAAVKHDD